MARRFVDLLVGIGDLGPQDRHDPVQIGVPEFHHQATWPALTTRLGVLLLAQQQLPHPQGQALPSYTLGSLEEEHLRHPARPYGVPQPLSYCYVSSQRCQRHGSISLVSGQSGRGQ